MKLTKCASFEADKRGKQLLTNRFLPLWLIPAIGPMDRLVDLEDVNDVDPRADHKMAHTSALCYTMAVLCRHEVSVQIVGCLSW